MDARVQVYSDKMQKAFDQIIGQGWLHYDAVEGVLENED